MIASVIQYQKETKAMTIDFNKEELLYVNWVSIRLGYDKAIDHEEDIKKYGLELEDLASMTDYDLDDHLSYYGIDFLGDKIDTMREMKRENLLQNGSYSDQELLDRFHDAMYGCKPVDKGGYDYDY